VTAKFMLDPSIEASTRRDWKFGDILRLRNGTLTDRRYMYICDDVGQGLVRLLTLIGRQVGEIVQEYESEMMKVDS